MGKKGYTDSCAGDKETDEEVTGNDLAYKGD
jgi:hypothetical protein